MPLIYLQIIMQLLESPAVQSEVDTIISALSGKGNQTSADTLQALADAAKVRVAERAQIAAQLNQPTLPGV